MRNRIAASIAAITRRQAKVALSTSVFVVLAGQETEDNSIVRPAGKKARLHPGEGSAADLSSLRRIWTQAQSKEGRAEDEV